MARDCLLAKDKLRFRAMAFAADMFYHYVSTLDFWYISHEDKTPLKSYADIFRAGSSLILNTSLNPHPYFMQGQLLKLSRIDRHNSMLQAECSSSHYTVA